MTFADRLAQQILCLGTPCCVGLDPVLELLPSAFRPSAGDGADLAACAQALADYCVRVLDALVGLVGVVKPQSAHFERYGAAGIAALQTTVRAARERGFLVILDAKRGDVPSTSALYAEAYLGTQPPRAFEIDALTLAPYVGLDGLAPFFRACHDHAKGVFVCVATSNDGAALLQETPGFEPPLYDTVARLLADEARTDLGVNGYGPIGAVVGATRGAVARRIRERLPHSFFLVPGFGHQGGALVDAGAYFDARGLGALPSASRSVLYPWLDGAGAPDLAAVRRAAEAFVRETDRALATAGVRIG